MSSPQSDKPLCSDIAGIQREDIGSLTAKFEAILQIRIEETSREHSKEMQTVKHEWDQCVSRLEDQSAELVVAKGIAAAASSQAEEHLKTILSIQKELQSAKMGLQLQQEQLKQQETHLHAERSAWMQEKSLIMNQLQNDKHEFQSLEQKLSRCSTIEDRALSVRSIVATSRALHPCSRSFFSWTGFVRMRLREFRHRITTRPIVIHLSTSRRRSMLQSAVSHWRQVRSRNVALTHLQVAATCLIVHRRLKNVFGLWFQTSCLPSSARIRGSRRDVLLSTRVARVLACNATGHHEQNEQTVSFLSHVIRAFSNVNCSAAFAAASASFKSLIAGNIPPSSLSASATELCSLFSACLKSLVEQDTKPRLQVRSSNRFQFYVCLFAKPPFDALCRSNPVEM